MNCKTAGIVIALLAVMFWVGGASAHFSDSVDLAVGRDGSLYATYESRHEVQVFDPAGKFIRCWGSIEQLFCPGGIAVDGVGYVYVSNFSEYVYKFSRAGQCVGRIRPAPGGVGEVSALAGGPHGGVYILPHSSNTVLRYDAARVLAQRIIVRGRSKTDVEPTGIAVDLMDNLYATFKSGCIVKYSRSGERVACFEPVDQNGYKIELVDITISESGSIYVLGRHSVWKLSKTGKVESGIDFWIPGQNPDFTCPDPPQAIAVDRRGFVYVAYEASIYQTKVEKYDPSWKQVRTSQLRHTN